MIITLFKLGDDILICLENKSINIIFCCKIWGRRTETVILGKISNKCSLFTLPTLLTLLTLFTLFTLFTLLTLLALLALLSPLTLVFNRFGARMLLCWLVLSFFRIRRVAVIWKRELSSAPKSEN